MSFLPGKTPSQPPGRNLHHVLQQVLDCVAADGSGYYILTPDEIQGNHRSYYQQHNFHMSTSGDLNNLSPQQQRGYYLNPAFIETPAPWGLAPSFDWLAATAQRLVGP